MVMLVMLVMLVKLVKLVMLVLYITNLLLPSPTAPTLLRFILYPPLEVVLYYKGSEP